MPWTILNPKRKLQGDNISFLRAFQSRNYRLFFAGQSFSLIGTWMQHVALSWLVYRLTGSALLLGVVGFVSQIPSLFVLPVAGVLADQWDRRKLLLAVQSLAMAQAVILSILVLAGVIRIWEIIALSALMGVVNSFDVPIRQAFVVEMVESREDLPNAIALNSSMFHGTRLIGPALAGILIGLVGEGVCFLMNAASYLAVICSLMAMSTAPVTPVARERRILPELKEGLTYAYRSIPIRSVLLLLAFVSLLGLPYVVLLPVFAREILHGGPHTYGFLLTASGMGSLAAALFLAAKKKVSGLGRIIAFSPAVLGVSIIAFSFSRSLALSLFILVFAGFGMMIQISASNTIIQTVVDDDKRGRVMSLYAMSFMGTAPFGCLLAGALAGRIGATATVFLAGAFCIAGSAVFICRRPRLGGQGGLVRQRSGLSGEGVRVPDPPGKNGRSGDE